jgi:hypothetical protein
MGGSWVEGGESGGGLPEKAIAAETRGGVAGGALLHGAEGADQLIRVGGEDGGDGLGIGGAGVGIGRIVGEVCAGNHEGIGAGGIGDGVADGPGGCGVGSAQHDGDQVELAEGALQEGELDFQHVIVEMRGGLGGEGRSGVQQAAGQVGIHRNIAERGAEGAGGPEGGGGITGAVAAAEQDNGGMAAAGDRTVGMGRDGPGVHIAGMRNDQHPGRRGGDCGGRNGGEKGIHFTGELVGIGGIKRAGKSGGADGAGVGGRGAAGEAPGGREQKSGRRQAEGTHFQIPGMGSPSGATPSTSRLRMT